MDPRVPVRSAVVGVDGSASSTAALAWARQIVGPGGSIREVHADSDPAESLLQAGVDMDADLIVIGLHTQSPLPPKRLGSVGKRLLSRTDRPVAVVGGDHARSVTPTTIVAGVGHGPATRAALAWSARFAETHGTALELIRAIPNRPVFRTDGLLDVLAFYIDPDMAHDWAMEDIEAMADEIQSSTDQELVISWSAPRGGTGPALVNASDGAALLVVGLHEDDRSDIAGWLQHALVHAPCPVVVVPATAEGSD